jgi:hypothetical protein
MDDDKTVTELNETIKLLEEQITALKRQVSLLYCNWNFDYKRFEELKAQCRNDNKNI